MTMNFSRVLSAGLFAVTMTAAPLAAQADDYHHNYGGYDHHNYGGDRGDYRGGDDRGHGGGIGVGGVLLGLGLGALVGGAIVSSQQPQYAPPPQYYAPPPPVYYAPPPPAYYAPPPGAYYQPY